MLGYRLIFSKILSATSSTLSLVVSTERMADGRRIVSSIQEITGMEETVVNMQEIFYFKLDTVDSKGQVIGAFRATGIRPSMLKRFEERGVALDETIFDPERVYE